MTSPTEGLPIVRIVEKGACQLFQIVDEFRNGILNPRWLDAEFQNLHISFQSIKAPPFDPLAYTQVRPDS
jgi:hypothetical protein